MPALMRGVACWQHSAPSMAACSTRPCVCHPTGGRCLILTDSRSLKAASRGTHWRTAPAEPLKVSNRTVLHLLNALQILQVKVPGGGAAEARRISFRALDIEQIGHVYEGLLDHTAKRATETVLGLREERTVNRKLRCRNSKPSKLKVWMNWRSS